MVMYFYKIEYYGENGLFEMKRPFFVLESDIEMFNYNLGKSVENLKNI